MDLALLRVTIKTLFHPYDQIVAAEHTVELMDSAHLIVLAADVVICLQGQ